MSTMFLPAFIFLFISAYITCIFQEVFRQYHWQISLFSNHEQSTLSPSKHRIAIIGAGAGGTSASYWLSTAFSEHGLQHSADIDIYEKHPYIGGRSQSVKVHDGANNLVEFELGAYSFGMSHKHLWRASEEFLLPRVPCSDPLESRYIWNGRTRTLIRIPDSIWDLLYFVTDYGLPYFLLGFGPNRAEEVLDEFTVAYSRDAPIWESVGNMIQDLSCSDLAASSAPNFLLRHGALRRVTEDLVIPILCGPIGQNITLNALHAAFTTRYKEPEFRILGGTHRIFEEFAARSGAQIYLNSTVHSITRQTGVRGWSVTAGSNFSRREYDAIILATPLSISGIDIPEDLLTQIPRASVAEVHVTVLATRSPTINLPFLGLPPRADNVQHLFRGDFSTESQLPFNVIQYDEQAGNGEWVVRIISEYPIGQEWLLHAFYGQVTWVHRHMWNIPSLDPLLTWAPFKLDDGFYYSSGLESVISSMETQLVSSRNAVSLLLRDQFSLEMCGESGVVASTPDPGAEGYGDQFVLGWDC